MKPLPWFALFLTLTILFAIPKAAEAAVFISEIMYDPSGADENHEWIEVTNDGAAAVDLNSWKLFEGGSNHKLTSDGASGSLAGGGVAIVAASPTAFRSDFPSYSGLVFDVSLSGGLNNTNGESLVLRDETLADKDTVTYAPTVGAAGDGNSLQKNSGTWVAANPTPGATYTPGSTQVATTITTPTSNSNSTGTGGTQTNSAQEAIQKGLPVPTLKVSIGGDRAVVAGAPARFEAKVIAPNGETVAVPRVVWSLGDGSMKEGSPTLLMYRFPGVYTLVADASNALYGGTDRARVTVVAPDVTISNATREFVEIQNKTSVELDIGGWQIGAGASTYVLPPRTILPARAQIKIPYAVAKLNVPEFSRVSLFFPDGTLVSPEAVRTSVDVTALPAAVITAVTKGASKSYAKKSTAVDLTHASSSKPAEPRSKIVRAFKAFFAALW